MATTSRELAGKALEITAGKFQGRAAFRPHWHNLSVVLSGSAPTEFADQFSSLDLVVVVPDELYGEVITALAGEGITLGPPDFRAEAFVEEAFNGRKLKFNVYPTGAIEAALKAHDDLALAIFSRAVALHDPKGLFELLKPLAQISPEVMASKLAERYYQLRQRQAALAWNLRRGQPFAFMDNLMSLLGHALAMCLLLAGEPPLGRKWLFLGAMRTDAGRLIRPLVFQLFSSLGDLATLGGQYNARKTRLYLLADEIQQAMSLLIQERGIVPSGITGSANDT